MAGYQQNPWISFLRQYGPIPRNDNMYDESIQRAIRRKKIEPLRLDTGLLPSLVENFKSSAPLSVILTGTAGDGKTYLCREIWSALGGSVDAWESDEKTRTLTLASGSALTVVKDLSEFHGDDYALLGQMAVAVTSEQSNDVYLIAANDGQLVEAWNRAPSSSSVDALRSSIEDLLVAGQSERAGVRLRLYNLSRTDTAELFNKLVRELLAHPGWKGCDGCRGQQPDPESRCPIWENFQRLHDPLFVERVTRLLELCDRNGFHLPMRQLLILASNALLGHPDAKECLLTCKEVPTVVQQEGTSLASIYSNVFGGNLGLGRLESTEAFEVLGRFGIGEETTNRIDNLLVFGADEPRLQALFSKLVRSDVTYGGHPAFLRLQSAYLEGTDEEDCKEYLARLPAQRQRLFFTLPADAVKDVGLWDLTVFQFAGEYLALIRQLLRGEKAPRNILSRLVQGMNRIFTGLLSNTDRELVLASSGSFSQARISRIEEYAISVDPRKGERISIEHAAGRALEFAVYLEPARRVPLVLNVLRYEFLSRVADGALPSSFSRECYEDILSYKSRLLREWLEMKRVYGEDEESPDEMVLRLLEVDPRGKIAMRPLTVRLGGKNA